MLNLFSVNSSFFHTEIVQVDDILPQKTRIRLSYVVNTVVADDQVL